MQATLQGFHKIKVKYACSKKWSVLYQFVPDTNNCQLLSCADDRQVRYHDLVAKKTLNVWSCSRARVKRLATVNTEPYLVWSASEDGIVRYVVWYIADVK